MIARAEAYLDRVESWFEGEEVRFEQRPALIGAKWGLGWIGLVIVLLGVLEALEAVK